MPTHDVPNARRSQRTPFRLKALCLSLDPTNHDVFGRYSSITPCTEKLENKIKEFGQIQAQCLLDHEMAEMSLVEKISYLQSQVHFDESMESIADSDLDFTTVCPKSFWETRCNGRSGERGKCTNVSFIRRLESFRETGCIVFINSVMNRETNVEFGNANLSHLSGTLPEGSKYHLLSQARSDLAKRELHVESLNKCIDDLQKRTEVQKQGTTGRTKRIC